MRAGGLRIALLLRGRPVMCVLSGRTIVHVLRGHPVVCVLSGRTNVRVLSVVMR